jgi:hypothetical protein
VCVKPIKFKTCKGNLLWLSVRDQRDVNSMCRKRSDSNSVMPAAWSGGISGKRGRAEINFELVDEIVR